MFLHRSHGLDGSARVGGEGPATEVGEGRGGGSHEHIVAVGRGEGRRGGFGHAGEGEGGPARGRVIDAAAAPLEHESQRSEREQEDCQEQE